MDPLLDVPFAKNPEADPPESNPDDEAADDAATVTADDEDDDAPLVPLLETAAATPVDPVDVGIAPVEVVARLAPVEVVDEEPVLLDAPDVVPDVAPAGPFAQYTMANCVSTAAQLPMGILRDWQLPQFTSVQFIRVTTLPPS